MSNDVVIIGGGPAGAALGCYLSRAGVANTIIEAAVHPRPHVGESLVTATTRVFDELGFLEVMEREGFVRKHGACWHPAAGGKRLRVEFCEIEQAGVHQDYTYHVDRARFDLLLLKHAEQLGSTVCQGVRVREVLLEGDRACGVRVTLAGQDLVIPCRLVVDASGRSTVLGSQLGLKQSDPRFQQFAVHAWFEGVDRGAHPDDIHVHFLPIARGWAWQIPISDAITSIGVVAERAVFRQGKRDHEAWFHEMSRAAPDIARALQDARRVSELSVEADYSYSMASVVGDGWMLVGDAARFVDPIFSSGVSVALQSAKFASEQIAQVFAAGGEPDRAALLPYEERLKAGVAIWYEFITLYYTLLPVFTWFISRPAYRLQVIQLLQGDVYDREEAPVLQAMREFIETVERTDGHLLRPYLDPALSSAASATVRERPGPGGEPRA